MNISNKLTAKVRERAAAINEQRLAARPTSELSVEDSIQAVIDSIPDIIAEKQLDELNCAEVMVLVRDRDFQLSTWKDRRFSREPKLEFLSAKAAAVFAYCAREGLNPHFAEFLTSDRKHSAIIIEWRLPETIVKEMLGDVTPGAFIAGLRQKTAAGQARKELQRQAQRSRAAMEVISQVKKLTDEAAYEGDNRARLTKFYGHSKTLNLEQDDWLGDIVAYCRTLGLAVEVTTCNSHDPGPLGLDFEHTLWAVWETDKKGAAAA
jgi:hypothetical protein